MKMEQREQEPGSQRKSSTYPATLHAAMRHVQPAIVEPKYLTAPDGDAVYWPARSVAVSILRLRLHSTYHLSRRRGLKRRGLQSPTRRSRWSAIVADKNEATLNRRRLRVQIAGTNVARRQSVATRVDRNIADPAPFDARRASCATLMGPI